MTSDGCDATAGGEVCSAYVPLFPEEVDAVADPGPSAYVVLYELLIVLDAARAGVFDDASPYRTGIREGLDQASILVRDRLARYVESGR